MTHDWINAQLITARQEDVSRQVSGGRRRPRRIVRSPRLRRLSL